MFDHRRCCGCYTASTGYPLSYLGRAAAVRRAARVTHAVAVGAVGLTRAPMLAGVRLLAWAGTILARH